MGNPLRNSRGFVLATSYLLLTLLSVFSLALYYRSFIFLRATDFFMERNRAFQMAESGVDTAIAALTEDTAYSGTDAYTAIGTTGGYEVAVCPPACTGLTAPTNSSIRLLQAAGYYPSNTAGAMQRNITAYVELDATPFEYGAFAKESLILNGHPLVDSYDSSVGDYGGANVGSDGDIASDGSLYLIGNPVVNGDVISNPGINCNPKASTQSSLGALAITNEYVLAAGTYRFSSINISGNGKLNLLGPVTIYVDGAVSISGNGVATSGDTPANLMIIVTGDGTVSLSGNADFYGSIVAPTSTVSNSGNGSIYGALISNIYHGSGGGDVHYDTRMKEVVAPCSDVRMRYWRENDTLFSSV